MAKYILKKKSEGKHLKVADGISISASDWIELAKEESKRALDAKKASEQHELYARACLNEAAKLMGFKNSDELDVYITIHGTL